ncbi:MAG: monophosphatase [Frankiales bacterium]|nr:monophosphatase [Frankiales bacterium]
MKLADLRELAEAGARSAGELLLGGRPETLTFETKTTPTDVVTEMDKAAERLLVEHLLGARPDDAVLAEEGGATQGTSGVRWVLDPIDGTVNYLYGLPGWAVCVAAEVDGVVEVGVVAHPAMDELYVGVRGEGAWCNGVPIAVGEPTELAQALIGTGFGYAVDRRTTQVAVLTAMLPQVRDIRRMGSAALDLCAVAGGRLDGYYERGLQPWDLAAAGLIAQEAGAVVAGLHGAPAGEDLVIAAPPTIFEALHDALAPLKPNEG